MLGIAIIQAIMDEGDRCIDKYPDLGAIDVYARVWIRMKIKYGHIIKGAFWN